MKTIFRTIIISLLILGITSCEDYLDLKPYGPPTTENFWKTENDALLAADGLYSYFGDDGVVGRGFMHYYNCSDDIVTGRPHPATERMKNFIAEYSRDVVDNWPTMYRIIKRCNDIIINVPEMDIPEDTKNKVLGQAYFFRAWAYFWIAPYYGDNGENGGIPIVEPNLPIDQLDVPRAESVRDNYAYCIVDFKKAADLLPILKDWPDSEYGRPHKDAAWAYVAAVALFDGQYDPAMYATTIEYCDKVIATKEYKLHDEFEDAFKVENNYGSEYLFSFVSHINGGSILPGVMLENKGWGKYNGWGYFMPTRELEGAYERGDKRLAATILRPGDKFTFLGEEKIYYSGESTSGMQFKKYMEPFKAADAINKTVSSNGDYPTTMLNMPLMRYSNILLMKAEAQIWSGQNGDEALNIVRKRAGLDPKTNATKEDLMNERRCEFAGEFSANRMLDLIRWGVAADYMKLPLTGYSAKPKAGIEVPTSKDDLIIIVKDGTDPLYPPVNTSRADRFNPKVHHVFPIPEREINKSKNLKQNKGY